MSAPSPLIKTTKAKRFEDFEIIDQVGEGTYGRVYKAAEKSSGQLVALKVLFKFPEEDGISLVTVKEIKFLKHLKNVKGIVNLLDTFFTNGSHFYCKNIKKEAFSSELGFLEGEVVLVFEWMSHDLSGIISSLRPHRISLKIIKCYMRQLLEALMEVHSRGLMHLDIKPANVLVNDSGQLFLADLGLMAHCEQPLRNNVVTRWYKSPELLLGSTTYGSEVDMWSVGCIFFEMLTGVTPFPGNDENHQFQLILNLCGSEALFQSPVFSKLPYFPKLFRHMGEPKASSLQASLRPCHLPPEAVDLLLRLLCLDPAKRITAEAAFEHDFFYTGVVPALEAEVPVFPFSAHEFEVTRKRKRRNIFADAGRAHPKPPPIPLN